MIDAPGASVVGDAGQLGLLDLSSLTVNGALRVTFPVFVSLYVYVITSPGRM